MKEMLSSTTSLDTDDPLPQKFKESWSTSVQSLTELESGCIPRQYSKHSYADSGKCLVHVFCDASKDAIGDVAYLQLVGAEGWEPTLSFLLVKGKLTHSGGNTIPRMELCAAVLGIEISDIIKEQLGVPSECFRFYTDSQIVLGYLTNTTHRVYAYVSNRVNRNHLSSSPNRWTYVPTEQNPVDQATRSVSALHLANSMWLTGPSCDITRTSVAFSISGTKQQLWGKIQIDDEKPQNRVREIFKVLNVGISWARGQTPKILVRKRIKHSDIDSVTAYELAVLFIIKTVQREV